MSCDIDVIAVGDAIDVAADVNVDAFCLKDVDVAVETNLKDVDIDVKNIDVTGVDFNVAGVDVVEIDIDVVNFDVVGVDIDVVDVDVEKDQLLRGEELFFPDGICDNGSTFLLTL